MTTGNYRSNILACGIRITDTLITLSIICFIVNILHISRQFEVHADSFFCLLVDIAAFVATITASCRLLACVLGALILILAIDVYHIIQLAHLIYSVLSSGNPSSMFFTITDNKEESIHISLVRGALTLITVSIVVIAMNVLLAYCSWRCLAYLKWMKTRRYSSISRDSESLPFLDEKKNYDY